MAIILKRKENNRHVAYMECDYCGCLHKIIRAHYWEGKNKDKLKPLSNMLLCTKCDRNIHGFSFNL